MNKKEYRRANDYPHVSTSVGWLFVVLAFLAGLIIVCVVFSL